jgi:hypothetical protein
LGRFALAFDSMMCFKRATGELDPLDREQAPLVPDFD